jgi:hypothetical protein
MEVQNNKNVIIEFELNHIEEWNLLHNHVSPSQDIFQLP